MIDRISYNFRRGDSVTESTRVFIADIRVSALKVNGLRSELVFTRKSEENESFEQFRKKCREYAENLLKEYQ